MKPVILINTPSTHECIRKPPSASADDDAWLARYDLRQVHLPGIPVHSSPPPGKVQVQHGNLNITDFTSIPPRPNTLPTLLLPSRSRLLRSHTLATQSPNATMLARLATLLLSGAALLQVHAQDTVPTPGDLVGTWNSKAGSTQTGPVRHDKNTAKEGSRLITMNRAFTTL